MASLDDQLANQKLKVGFYNQQVPFDSLVYGYESPANHRARGDEEGAKIIEETIEQRLKSYSKISARELSRNADYFELRAMFDYVQKQPHTIEGGALAMNLADAISNHQAHRAFFRY